MMYVHEGDLKGIAEGERMLSAKVMENVIESHTEEIVTHVSDRSGSWGRHLLQVKDLAYPDQKDLA